MQLNNQGCVCDVAESYQEETGESPDLCGPWSVKSLQYAGLPGKGATGTAEQIDQGADKEADVWLSGGHVAALGSTIENMHSFLHDAGNLHYWDITPDVAHITAAVKAGYPVLVTANEQNIKEKRTGKRPPYPWNIDANHILPITGIDAEGDFISPDQLNNNFQGYWPVVYVASVLNPSWATVVQLVGPDASKPWLKPIPSGDPTDSNWKNFNAQNFGGNVQPIPNPTPQMTAQEKQFQDIWNATAPLFGGKPLDYTTGFAQDWQNKYMPKFFIGPPITEEFQTVDWNDQPITVQLFTNGMAQDNAGHHRWWVDDREITF